jgi:hypothetical protein
VPTELVARMADRMWKFGSDARRQHFVAKAMARLDTGKLRRSDVATVLAAGGA